MKNKLNSINSDFSVQTFKGGFDNNFSYIITCLRTGYEIIIDAAIELDKLEPFLNERRCVYQITYKTPYLTTGAVEKYGGSATEEQAKSDEKDAWHGNIAVPHLIFDDKDGFKKNLGDFFSIEYDKFTECLIFLNSGGVTSKTKYIPMNRFFLNILNFIDKILVKFFPNIFCMGRRIVLKKLN